MKCIARYFTVVLHIGVPPMGRGLKIPALITQSTQFFLLIDIKLRTQSLLIK